MSEAVTSAHADYHNLPFDDASFGAYVANLANNNVRNLTQGQLDSGFCKTSGGACFSSICQSICMSSALFDSVVVGV